MVYYPVPLHKQKAYMDMRYDKIDFSNTEKLNNCVISLPMHTEMTEEQLAYITQTVIEFKK
jgi:UDP-2-acetamido-2-deoxy-ribo-hexuluronate aminotransferase